MIHRHLAACALGLSCAVFAASCVQSPESPTETQPGEVHGSVTVGEAQAPLLPAHDPEPIGEATQEWTKADCYAAWQHNGRLCNSSPPNLRLACYAAVAAVLTACLAAAQG